MKGVHFLRAVLLIALFAVVFAGCPTIGKSLQPGEGESLVIVKYNDTEGMMIHKGVIIFIDGKQVFTLRGGQTGRFIVKNGKHTIYAINVYENKGETYTFEVNSEEIFFAVDWFARLREPFVW